MAEAKSTGIKPAGRAGFAYLRGPDDALVEYQGDMPVGFGDVSLFWYMNRTDMPAVSTRGHLMDHIALSVTDLDAWIAKLRAEKVTFLEQPYLDGA